MAIFDEREVVAGHERLATSVSGEIAALKACAELILKAVKVAKFSSDNELHADQLAASILALRTRNNAGACSQLIDRGYFVQAASFLRDTSEIGMLALYFANNKQKLREWRLTDGGARYTKFGRSRLKKALVDDPATKAKFTWLDYHFDLFSEYGTHPSAISIAAHHDGSNLHTGPHINEDRFIRTYKDLAVLTWHVTDTLGDLWVAQGQANLEEQASEEVAAYRNTWSLIAP